MSKYGLLGYPLGHSFSKRFFLKKFEREGITAAFENFEFKDVSAMEGIILGMPDLKGFAVTLPHKQKILEVLNETDEAVEEIGAVNCVKITRSGGCITLKGYNTDVIGFQQSFEEFLKKEHQSALVLGTGGASKAVLYVLKKRGIAYDLVSRTKTSETICYEDITKERLKNTPLVINATPLGMHPQVKTCPDLPYESVTSDHYFYDLVYNPRETLFLKKAKAQGAVTKNGGDMLELQAEANWKIWNQS